MKRVALLIDGGHLRALGRQDRHAFTPDFIERFARECIDEGEELLRALYYDCAPYTGTARLPVSGRETTFRGDPSWLEDLAARDFFAVRLASSSSEAFRPGACPLRPKA